MKKSIPVILTLIFIFATCDSYSQLIWSTYLGGNHEYPISDMKIDNAGNPYITGVTVAKNFPITTGCYDSIFKSSEIFVTKFNSNGSDLIFSTFISGNAVQAGIMDYVSSLDIDFNDNIYITGYTKSGNYPLTANGFGVFQFTINHYKFSCKQSMC